MAKENIFAMPVSIYALGGLGEVGKNMYVVENEKTLIIIDVGVRFPEASLPGVDYVIPDFSYLRNNSKKVKAVFITHGHEDHIGAIPFLIQTIHIPVIYAPPLAAALIRHKLGMMRIKTPVKIVEYKPEDIYQVDSFKVSFFAVTHSIPDCFGICVDTTEGRIVSTGDYKIDLTPIGRPMDLGKISQIGNEGVELMLGDSTNVEKEGYTPSERIVISAINDIFAQTTGRLIISTFSSNISRIQQIVEATVNFNRKLVIIGRTMERVVAASRELGYIKIPDASLIDVGKIYTLKPEETVILCTGSQGEPLAALSRIADGTHKDVRIIPGDTVVFSSSPIPGNGAGIDRVVNQLTRLGADVLTNSILRNIHSSGHPSQEELKLMLRLFNPAYFMPIHGEYRMLKLHAELAQKLGMPKENTFVLKNGETILLRNKRVSVGPTIPCEDIYIDGNSLNGVSEAVLSDRRKLSEDGMVSVLIALDSKNNKLMMPIEIYSRGFINFEISHLLPRAQARINEAVNKLMASKSTTFGEIKLICKEVLEPYFYDKTGRSPMIIPVVMNKVK